MLHTQYTERVPVQTMNELPEKTHQSFADEVDINRIIKRHTDARIPLPTVGLVYQDVSELTDYRDALDNVTKVRDIFMQLPASSRAYFDNDAAIFLDWTFDNPAELVDSLVHGPPVPAAPETPPDPVDRPTDPETPPDPPGDA